MAFTNRQIKSATASNATTITATLDSTAVAGNLLVAAWTAIGGPGTVTPPSTFTQAFTDTGSSLIPSLFVWYKVAAGSETAVTVANTSLVTQDIFVWEYQGFTGTPTLDKVISNNAGASSVVTLSTGTTAATSVATEIAFAAVGLSGTSGAITTNWTNSYVDEAGRAATRMYLATKALSSTGTQESTLAWTASRKVAAGIATFMDVAGAPNTTNFFQFI